MDYAQLKPVPKVAAGSLAGAVATLGWWILTDATELLADPPAAVVAASVVVIGGVFSWLAPRSDIKGTRRAD